MTYKVRLRGVWTTGQRLAVIFWLEISGPEHTDRRCAKIMLNTFGNFCDGRSGTGHFGPTSPYQCPMFVRQFWGTRGVDTLVEFKQDLGVSSQVMIGHFSGQRLEYDSDD
jgi:hypothetical protein